MTVPMRAAMGSIPRTDKSGDVTFNFGGLHGAAGSLLRRMIG